MLWRSYIIWLSWHYRAQIMIKTPHYVTSKCIILTLYWWILRCYPVSSLSIICRLKWHLWRIRDALTAIFRLIYLRQLSLIIYWWIALLIFLILFGHLIIEGKGAIFFHFITWKEWFWALILFFIIWLRWLPFRFKLRFDSRNLVVNNFIDIMLTFSLLGVRVVFRRLVIWLDL